MASSPVLLKLHVKHVSGLIVRAAMRGHSVLLELLERAHEACLVHELRKPGLKVSQQLLLPVVYEGVTIDLGYRMDLLLEHSVVVELKCVETISPIQEAKGVSYLRLSGKNIGSPHQFSRCTPQRRHQTIVERQKLGVMNSSPVILCALWG